MCNHLLSNTLTTTQSLTHFGAWPGSFAALPLLSSTNLGPSEAVSSPVDQARPVSQAHDCVEASAC